MEHGWRIELLGGLRVQRGDQVISRFPKQLVASLLAYLAAHPQYSRARDVLPETLCPELGPDEARNNLRVALHLFRRLLEPPDAPEAAPLLTVDRRTIRLNPAAVTTDLAEFEAALGAAAPARGYPAASSDEQLSYLARAVDLYRGELLAGFAEEWVFTERRHRAEQYLEALHRLVSGFEEAGDLKQALEYGRRAVLADPLREEAHYDLMRLYAAAGQPSACLQQYQELERLLREELNEKPSAAARALAEELRDQARTVVVARSGPPVPAVMASTPPHPPSIDSHEPGTPAAGSSVVPALGVAPLPAPSAPRLPVQFTRFFGREEEIVHLAAMLRVPETRLVTLTGPGGSGKTRLAIAVAGRLQAEFEGAVWFVPLAEVADSRRIGDTIRDALGLPSSAGGEPLEQAVAALAQRRALLILDNFEQLVESGATLVRRLLERAPSLTCLVTSRQRLELEGEQEFVVLPLPTPSNFGFRVPSGRLDFGLPAKSNTSDDRTSLSAPIQNPNAQRAPEIQNPKSKIQNPEALLQYPSVALFVDRAQSARRAFELTAENAAAVAQLCDRLEGLPLALELAAARAGALAPQQILDRLSHRFDLLVSPHRDISARHRTLRAAIEWSFQLLAPELQRFFTRLSVFRGGWTLEAAEAVCGDFGFWILDFGLDPTRSKAFEAHDRLPLSAIQNPKSKIQNTLDCLGQLRESSLIVTEEAPDSGAMRYRMLETLREFAAERRAPEEREELAAAHAQYYLRLAEQAKAESCGAAQSAWLARLETEHDNMRAALEWCQTVGDVKLGSALGTALVWFWHTRGHLTEGRERLAALLARVGDHAVEPVDVTTRARVLLYAGRLAHLQGDFESARPLLDESLSLARSAGAAELIATCLGEMAVLAPDLRVKRTLYEESLAFYRELDDDAGVASVLVSLGAIAASWYDLVRARALYQEGLTILRQLGDPSRIAWALIHLGLLSYYQGDYAAFRAHTEESLALFQTPGDRMGIAASLHQLGTVALVEDAPEEAAGLYEQALQIARELGSQLDIARNLARLGEVALVQGDRQTAAADCEQALAIFRAHDDRRDVVRTLLRLGAVAEQEGQRERAAALYAEGLAGAQEEENQGSLLTGLEGLARAAAAAGEEEQGVRLLGCAAARREALGAPLPPYLQWWNEGALGAARTALGEAAFAAAWEAGQALSLEQAVALALAPQRQA